MRITTGIASTTHIDRDGERFAKSALDGMAKQIRSRYVPHLVDHNPDLHIGVLLYGEVFQLSDGEHALGFVAGIFESESEKQKFPTGSTNRVWQDFKAHLDKEQIIESHRQHGKGHAVPPVRDKTIAGRVEKYLDSTSVWQDGRVLKTKKFVARVKDLRIEVYPKDHAPSHFHVISRQRGINARFSLDTLELMNVKHGRIKPNDVRKIQSFFEQNPSVIEELRREGERLVGK